MEIKYNVTDRKSFVKAISEIVGEPSKYLGSPSFAYKITDWYTVTKDGNLDIFDRADSEEVEQLLEQLLKKGYKADTVDTEENEPCIAVCIPTDAADIPNLRNLLAAKGELIKHALDIDSLEFEVDSEKISFPWFSETSDSDDVKTYTEFISAICKMSRDQKRITAKQKTVDNEKYAFRCFLLRLGFIGDEYKLTRKILLKNLNGSSAFKSGARKEHSDDIPR